MKNLLERLKPELKAHFDAKALTHPNTVERFYKNLSNVYFCIDIRYGEVIELQKACKEVDIPCEIIWNCFTPDEVLLGK